MEGGGRGGWETRGVYEENFAGGVGRGLEALKLYDVEVFRWGLYGG